MNCRTLLWTLLVLSSHLMAGGLAWLLWLAFCQDDRARRFRQGRSRNRRRGVWDIRWP